MSHEEVFPGGNLVAVFDAAGGTIATDAKLPPENKWRASAAWLAIVESGLVKQWRVYADNKPVYDITRSPFIVKWAPQHREPSR